MQDGIKKKTIEKETKNKNGVRDIPIPLFCLELIKYYLAY